MSDPAQLELLIEKVRASEQSDFYRTAWNDAQSFADVPTVDRSNFYTPLSKRRYKDASALVKIVRGERPFLSEWDFTDIGKEVFGEPSQRPFVYMTDSYEAIEKSMWCYERGMVPLIGEKDPDIAMFAAGKYDVDSLITDPAAIEKMRPYLESHKLSSISIIGESFDPRGLSVYADFAESVRLVLALPETGVIGVASLEPTPKFEAPEGTRIERSEAGIIVTKLRLLVTPVIRYQTQISTSIYDGA